MKPTDFNGKIVWFHLGLVEKQQYKPSRSIVIDIKEPPSDLITIRMELFGSARLLCGSQIIDVETPRITNTVQLTTTLATNHPELVGKVIRTDRRGLLESYTFNLNGVSFVGPGTLQLHSGDSILLFSSQAGG